MATAGGHWNTLAEAAKLTHDTLLPGVVETDIKRNNPIEMAPIAQAGSTGPNIDWVKESTGVEDSVDTLGIGGETSWTDNVTYTTGTATLKISYVQRKLDTYVESIYGNINNYREQVVKEMRKGVMRYMGDKFFYGDKDAVAEEWDGLHALRAELGACAANTIDIDQGGALSLMNIRIVLDEMVHGCDVILMPYTIKRYIDQAYFEKGLRTDTTEALQEYMTMLPMITHTTNDAGKRITSFDGVPIVPTDYLVQETDGTGNTEGEQRTKGTDNYTVFFIKWGTAGLTSQDPGVKFGFGHPDEELGEGQFFTLNYFEKLETHIAKGFRLYNFGALIMPSPFAVGRILDVSAAAVVA